MSLHATHRDAGPVTVVDLSGRIVLGDGSALLRKTIRGLLEDQRKLILLNLAKKVRDLLQITKLYTVFDVFTDENTALRSFI
jgi:anti-sigma B factor antagonist